MGALVFDRFKHLEYARSCNKKRPKLPYGLSAFRNLRNSYKKHAVSRGLIFNLSEDEFRVLTKSNCFYCNSEPSNVFKGRQLRSNGEYVYNGIDRVDNSKGYISGNVVSCCRKCNWAKAQMSQQDFIDWVRKVHLHLTKMGG